MVRFFTFSFFFLFSLGLWGQGAKSLPNKDPKGDYFRSGNNRQNTKRVGRKNSSKPTYNGKNATEESAEKVKAGAPDMTYEKLDVGIFNAHYLPRLDPSSYCKTEIQISFGPLIPCGEFSRIAFTDKFGEPRVNGAKTGFGVDFSFHAYPVNFFGIGIFGGGNFFGYDADAGGAYVLNHFSSREQPYKLDKSSKWNDFHIGLNALTRIPITDRLYFTANINARFVFITSPMMKFSTNLSQNSDPNILAERYMFDWDKNKKGTFAFGGGIGLLYRITKQLNAKVNMEYVQANPELTQHYTETYHKETKVGEDSFWTQNPIRENSHKVFQSYSYFNISIGISYGF